MGASLSAVKGSTEGGALPGCLAADLSTCTCLPLRALAPPGLPGLTRTSVTTCACLRVCVCVCMCVCACAPCVRAALGLGY